MAIILTMGPPGKQNPSYEKKNYENQNTNSTIRTYIKKICMSSNCVAFPSLTSIKKQVFHNMI